MTEPSAVGPSVVHRPRIAWFCLACRRCGEVEASRLLGQRGIVDRAKKDHNALSPSCSNGAKVIDARAVEVK